MSLVSHEITKTKNILTPMEVWDALRWHNIKMCLIAMTPISIWSISPLVNRGWGISRLKIIFYKISPKGAPPHYKDNSGAERSGIGKIYILYKKVYIFVHVFFSRCRMIQYRLKGKIFRLLSLITQLSIDSNVREVFKKDCFIWFSSLGFFLSVFRKKKRQYLIDGPFKFRE
jgi:hypothetical protein